MSKSRGYWSEEIVNGWTCVIYDDDSDMPYDGKVHCFIQRCNKSFRINLNPDGAFWDGHEPSNDDINLRERSKCLSYCETHLSKLRFIYDKVRE